jgi:hypothetical protein
VMTEVGSCKMRGMRGFSRPWVGRLRLFYADGSQ